MIITCLSLVFFIIQLAVVPKMATSTKIFDFFRNLKSDAVPKAPRPEKQDSDNDVTDAQRELNEEFVEQDEEEIVINLDGVKGTEKPKSSNKTFYNTSKKKQDIPKPDKNSKQHTGYNNVNTQGWYLTNDFSNY